jgi:hypothetical protein
MQSFSQRLKCYSFRLENLASAKYQCTGALTKPLVNFTIIFHFMPDGKPTTLLLSSKDQPLVL